MKLLRFFLLLSTIAIYFITIIAIKDYGFNWPAVAINDLISLSWRTQFDIDFIIHLLLLSIWVIWREGGTAKAYLFGALSIVMGGMFSFPYIIYISFVSRGNPKYFLLGIHAKS
jgi:hypothetical protein